MDGNDAVGIELRNFGVAKPDRAQDFARVLADHRRKWRADRTGRSAQFWRYRNCLHRFTVGKTYRVDGMARLDLLEFDDFPISIDRGANEIVRFAYRKPFCRSPLLQYGLDNRFQSTVMLL